ADGDTPHGAGVESANGGKEVDDQHAAGAVEFLDLRAQVEQHPGVHEDMKDAAVEEAGRYQAPVFASHDPQFPLGAEGDQSGDIEVHERFLIPIAHAENRAGDVETEVEQQNNGGVEAEM